MKMKKNVLLIIPPYKKYGVPLIPIGILYIADHLIRNKIEYDILDLNFCYSYHNTLIKQLTENAPDFVGISIRNIAETEHLNSIYKQLCDIVTVSKASAKVVLGGAGFSIFPKEIMKMTGADFGIIGPGEVSFLELINSVNSATSESIIIGTEDTFPSSDISLSLLRYWEKYGKFFLHSEVDIPIQTTRGCKYSCEYCTYPLISNYSVQKRPVQKVVSEIEKIIAATENRQFCFVDSVFNMDLDYCKELLCYIINKKVDIKWRCTINPIKYDDELFTLMKRSGCSYCEVGIDSLSNIMLEKMNKGYNVSMAEMMLYKLESYNIPYSLSLIMGGYGETKRSLTETMNIIMQHDIDKVNVFLGERIYPGTPLAKKLNRDTEELLYAGEKSIYLESSIIDLLKTLVNSNMKNWTFIGGKL